MFPIRDGVLNSYLILLGQSFTLDTSQLRAKTVTYHWDSYPWIITTLKVKPSNHRRAETKFISAVKNVTHMDTMSITKSPTHVLPGFAAVTPFITVEDPAQLVEFAKAAFEAAELKGQRGTNHAAFRIEGCVIEAGRAHGQWKAMPTALHLYVRDADSAYARAMKAGAVRLHEVREMDYGERAAAVQDPFGNHWYIATYTGGKKS